MTRLPQTGVELIAAGTERFLADLRRGSAGVTAFGEMTIGALREVGALATHAMVDAGRATAGFLRDSTATAGDFEQTLNVLRVTSGATAEELQAVGQRAIALGADMTLPATSAQDAANVMLELSKAGFSVQEAMDAAKGSLQLAAAAQIDSASAAAITAAAINAFDLEAREAGRVADLLAAGANASSASIGDLSAGLQQAGFAMHTTGQSIDDTITALAALTNVGLTGSDAGTALKNAFMRLMNPTEKAAKLMQDLGLRAYDAQGNMKALPQLLDEINAATAGMTNEQRDAVLSTIFLSDGMKALVPLLELGSTGFLALREAVTPVGTAAAVANAQMQGWNGALAAVRSQLETLQLVIGQQVLPLLTPLVQQFALGIGNVTGFVQALAPMIPTILHANEPFRAFLDALVQINPNLRTFAAVALTVYEPVSTLVRIVQESGIQSRAFTDALIGLLQQLGATPAAATTVATAIQQMAGWITGTAIPAVQQLAQHFVTQLPTGIAAGIQAFAAIATKVNEVMPYIQSFVQTTLTFISALWQTHGATIMNIASSAWMAISGIIKTVLGAIQGAMAVATAAMTGDWKSQQDAMRRASELIWNGLKQFLIGVLETIAAAFGTSLSNIANVWQSNWQALAQIASTLMRQAEAAVTGALQSIGSAFSGIVNHIQGAIVAIREFVNAASTITVPKLVKPGSPSPLEVSLRGIAEGFTLAGQAAQAMMPAMPAPAPASVVLGGDVGVTLRMGQDMGWLDARIDHRLRMQAQQGAARGRV